MPRVPINVHLQPEIFSSPALALNVLRPLNFQLVFLSRLHLLDRSFFSYPNDRPQRQIGEKEGRRAKKTISKKIS